MFGKVLELSRRVGAETPLSTTGYQVAMMRLNKPDKPDAGSKMTLDRANQYVQTAKRSYPSSTLKSLGELQRDTINRTPKGELRGGVEMSVQELGPYIQNCRAHRFGNCDTQSLEIGLHLRHGLGLSNFKIVSNHKISHNYVVIEPDSQFPKGAIVDPWAGHHVLELNPETTRQYRHRGDNFATNKIMREWIEKHGAEYVRPDLVALPEDEP